MPAVYLGMNPFAALDLAVFYCQESGPPGNEADYIPISTSPQPASNNAATSAHNWVHAFCSSGGSLASSALSRMPARFREPPGRESKDKAKYTLDEAVRGKSHARVQELLASFPVYPEIDLPFLLESFDLA